MSRLVLPLILIGCVLSTRAQNYLGAGNDNNVTVTASDAWQDAVWPASADPENTVNGQGMLHDYFQASRFLRQASLGFDSTHVEDVLNMGYATWIDDQFNKGITHTLPETESIFTHLDNLHGDNDRRPDWRHFNYAWWQINTTNDDLLRHRVACALSEILVVSRNSDLSGYGDALASYYDKLLEGAFGNYQDLLTDVVYHVAMGHYLSHLSNPKTDTTTGQHPDENFAREIMQLFTIGLYELNLDGTHKQSGGNDIPTYDNDDIAEYAKVFTGLGIAELLPELADPGDTATFWYGLWEANVTVPMRMYDADDPGTSWRDEDQHEPGVKNLLNGYVVPANQPGEADIAIAVESLFEHPNVGPFIGYRLIQRLVKSNPSSGYVSRVAQAFNGTGPYGTVRGDMKSVVKAILLDDEARSEDAQSDDLNSKLIEPLFRYTHFSRAVSKTNPNNWYWNIGWQFYEEAKQAILASPSVFNFFLPDDAPNGAIADQGLVAPEFKIHDSRTSIGYMNNVYRWVASWGEIMNNWEGDVLSEEQREVRWNIDQLMVLARDTEAYLNWIDKHVLSGNMTDRTRKIIRKALNGFSPGIEWHDYQENRVRMGMYLALVAPEYSTLR
ncbi:MAG: DUF1800 family protein [Saprospiraceae bacterium]|nr:DUF1800 family protein [Saprospiraceae bacterium]